VHDDAAYTERLVGSRWKPSFLVQAPYRWNIRRLGLGRVLDVGCGIGRNLLHLDGNGVGVDTNPHSVGVARDRGLIAYTPGSFADSDDAVPGAFDALLFAHVLEHMTNAEAEDLVGAYLPYLRPGGKVVIIVPQEAGYASDDTHVEFVDDETIRAIERRHGLTAISVRSFPFPRPMGRGFRHNETVAVARKPDR
jgi:SAM-dependent methyltransferase